MKEPRPLKELLGAADWVSIVLLGVLFLIGLATIWSAAGGAAGMGAYYTLRQALWGLVALAASALVWKIDFRWLAKQSYWIYAASCLLLAALFIIGHTAKGAQSWVKLGTVRFQPSEFVKIALALVMANHCVRFEPRRLGGFFAALGLGALSTVLVLVQPDLGSALVYSVMIFLALWTAGTPRRYLFSLMGAGLALLPLGWLVLKDYQKNRLLVFLDPALDPLGAGYNVIQSRIAVGSGGLWGQGFMAGTQSKLRFLPEPHTDFIFSVFAEEFGFVGGLVIILLFGVLCWRVLGGALRQHDRRHKIWVCAMTGWIWFQFFEGVAMSMGLMPVTGLPVPLLSYGGSALLATVVAFAMCLKVGALARLKSEESNVALDAVPSAGLDWGKDRL